MSWELQKELLPHYHKCASNRDETLNHHISPRKQVVLKGSFPLRNFLHFTLPIVSGFLAVFSLLFVVLNALCLVDGGASIRLIFVFIWSDHLEELGRQDQIHHVFFVRVLCF